jgi:hypothetical protein
MEFIWVYIHIIWIHFKFIFPSILFVNIDNIIALLLVLNIVMYLNVLH